MTRVGGDKNGSDSDGEALPDNIEDLKLDEILKKKTQKKKREMTLITDEDLMKRYWGENS